MGFLRIVLHPASSILELTRSVLGISGIQELTQRVPAQRLGTVDEIARLIVWLSSTLENSFISGQNIAIDGGFIRV